jgi:hypothetical protein
VVEFISNCAEIAGVIVPIPTLCACTIIINDNANEKRIIFFILVNFLVRFKNENTKGDDSG